MKQPTALRLADELLDAQPEDLLETELVPNAAAELRRLHEANKEMLEALKNLVNGFGFAPAESIKKARAAIAKVEQQ